MSAFLNEKAEILRCLLYINVILLVLFLINFVLEFRWLDPGAFGTLGVGGGFALGAKLVRPESEVWVVYGDGSLGYSIAEFDTFIRHKVGSNGLCGFINIAAVVHHSTIGLKICLAKISSFDAKPLMGRHEKFLQLFKAYF